MLGGSGRNGFAIGLVIGLALAAGLFVWLSGGVPGWWKHDGALVTSRDTLANWLVAIFSFVAAVFLWLTLLATQEMAKDTRRIGEAQVRAYLTVIEVLLDFRNGREDASELSIRLVNTGNSPANKINIDHRFEFADGTKTDSRTFFPNDLQASGQMHRLLPAHIAQTSVGLHLPENHEEVVTLIADLKIAFEDVFGISRTESHRFIAAFRLPVPQVLKLNSMSGIPEGIRGRPWKVHERSG